MATAWSAPSQTQRLFADGLLSSQSFAATGVRRTGTHRRLSLLSSNAEELRAQRSHLLRLRRARRARASGVHRAKRLLRVFPEHFLNESTSLVPAAVAKGQQHDEDLGFLIGFSRFSMSFPRFLMILQGQIKIQKRFSKPCQRWEISATASYWDPFCWH